MQLLGPARLAVLVAVSALFLALWPGLATAHHVQCGDTIIQDTRLDTDLSCTDESRSAITIASGGVTLDLGGHTITGPPTDDEAAGISTTGVSGVIVRNGTVHDFATDVFLRDVTDSLVTSVNGATIRVIGDRNTIARNTAVHGLAVTGNDNCIVGNEITDPLSFDNATWLLVSGEGGLVSRNVLTNVGAGSADFTAVGISAALANGTITRNIVLGRPPSVQGTDVSARGISSSGAGALISRNVVSEVDDGISVWASSTVERNLVFDNRDDGIEVGVPGATLRRNTANDNGDRGIEAVPGTIDAGGNRAEGNGNPAQCVGVRCK